MIRRVLLAVALLLPPYAAAQPTEPDTAAPPTTAAAASTETAVETPPSSRSRFGSTLGQPQPTRFGVNAAAGTQLSYVQVQSTVLELSELEVSGLGNAGNAALEQQLRTALLAPNGLAALGKSESRNLSLSVSSKTPAGTVLTTRWQAPNGADVTLTQTLLASADGGLGRMASFNSSAGLVQISSDDSILAAQLRAKLPHSPRDLSLGLDAPYGLILREGESQSRQARRDLQPLLAELTALLSGALGNALPAPTNPAPASFAPATARFTDPNPLNTNPLDTNIEPLLTSRSTLFQGRNSRGNLLFQVQGNLVNAKPWTAQWSGPLGLGPLGSNNALAASTSSPSTLLHISAKVPAASEFAQAIYRPDGLLDSAFEFDTLTLRLNAQAGEATIRVGLQLRRTLALRPIGTPAASTSREN